MFLAADTYKVFWYFYPKCLACFCPSANADWGKMYTNNPSLFSWWDLKLSQPQDQTQNPVTFRDH